MGKYMEEAGYADVLTFDLNTIRAATNNFSTDNKLGEGGFGFVYKISGKKNKHKYKETSLNLIGDVWDFWNEERALEIIDPSLGESYDGQEVLRCIHVGLLCVQLHSNDRPTMSEVIFMLSNDTELSRPNRPGFALNQGNNAAPLTYSTSDGGSGNQSSNTMSITELESFVLTMFLSFLVLCLCSSTDTITFNQPLKDGDLLISNDSSYALGFFTPGNSIGKRYVGLWYLNIPEKVVVWVANRDNPVNGTSGILFIDSTGNLVIQDNKTGTPVWNTSLSFEPTAGTRDYSAQLKDTGNLVLYHDQERRVDKWQSFDYPTNTILASMKFGVDKKNSLNWFMRSWKSPDDPGTGEYTVGIDLTGKPQVYLKRSWGQIWRSGPWNGVGLNGVPETAQNGFNFRYTENGDEVTITYSLKDPSVPSMFVLNESGTVNWLTWQGNKGWKWVTFTSAPKDVCDHYAHCGAFSNCNPYNSGFFECTCLPGFEPRSDREWRAGNGTDGCRRNNTDVCGNGEGFIKMTNFKIPETNISRVNRTIGLAECEEICLKNCSCSGYASANISGGGMGCITWHGDLIDMRGFASGGQDLYVRVSASDLLNKSKGLPGKTFIVILVPVAAAVLVVLLLCCLLVKMRKGNNSTRNNPSNHYEGSEMGKHVDETGSSDLSIFDLNTIQSATDNFSSENKLGQGGFGSVYKLSNETELPQPNQPGFIFKHGSGFLPSTSTSTLENQSINDMSITKIEGR
nr:G-type lectin S-receptor-like serine/threonine-protein kinase At1g11410 [Ipomoea batatas]